ncbi:MAG: B12-binding domain-containing radical SAM protein [Gemmatimonadota bacterium]
MTRPAVALVGAEFEENLSLRYLSSAVAREGFDSLLLPFNEEGDAAAICEAVRRHAPLLVGISVPFQTRAAELLGLAGRLREKGYEGHVCAGGHFATFEYENLLRDFPAVDSVVRHEGEATLREMCVRLSRREEVAGLAGVVTRGSGETGVGPKRPLPPLDELPFPDRRGEPHRVMGVRCSPILGSRGCYADCSFCCIYAYAENADGARYRRRSPENIAREMAQEYHDRGVRLFVFHDDNFFIPSAPKNLARYRRLHELLNAAGVREIALVIKCRPNDVDRELFRHLKEMGMIRAYVGIETNSEEGVVSLNRRISPEDNRRALELFRSLDVYASFNVLIFDPEATLEGVRKNLDFMEEFAEIPFNFCRAEVYAGTPLKAILESEGRLQGDYLAWSYEMRDPRVELLFRIATTAFMARNFKPYGVANLNLGIRFDNEVVRRFYPECWDLPWHASLVDLSRRIGEDSVRRMREALGFVLSSDVYDHDTAKRFTLELARKVNRSDLAFVAEIKQARRELERRILRARGAEALTDYSDERPPWAAESARLQGSTGLEVSTELLPEPRLVQGAIR